MSQVGRPLDLWQQFAVHDAFALRTDSLWAAFELLVLLARQNGKGGVTEAIELGSMFLFKEPLLFHSAHQFKTSTAAFRRLIDIIEGSDWLTRRVQNVSRSKGDESINLTRRAGGSRLQFVARTLGSGRGLTGSKTIFDEAAWLTVGQYAAQTPGLATIPNPQIIYTSTPPDEDVGPMPEDAMLPSVRRRAHAGEDRIAIHEWGPLPGYNRADPDVWYRCNPALGIRIAPWFLAKQLANFASAGKPEKFDTEHLGVWPPAADEQWQVISEGQWAATLDAQSRAGDPQAIGIDMTADRSMTSIGVAGRRTDGLMHGQLATHGPGTGWVVDWVVKALAERKICAVVIGASGPARSLIPALTEAGVDVLTPGTADVAAACGALYDQIATRDTPPTFRHTGQGPLTAAVAGAARKRLGDAWLWDRLGVSVDVSPIFAVTLAAYGHATRASGWSGNYDPLSNIW